MANREERRVERPYKKVADIEVRTRKGEPVEKALRRLKKKLDREGVITAVKDKRYHQKPSKRKQLRKKRLAFTDMLRRRYEDQ